MEETKLYSNCVLVSASECEVLQAGHILDHYHIILSIYCHKFTEWCLFTFVCTASGQSV